MTWRSHRTYQSRHRSFDAPREFKDFAGKPSLRKTRSIEKKLDPIDLDSLSKYESTFIGPSGKFYGVAGFHHHALSQKVDLSPSEMEDLGFIRAFSPKDQKATAMQMHLIPTEAQVKSMQTLIDTFPDYQVVFVARISGPKEYFEGKRYYSMADFKAAMEA